MNGSTYDAFARAIGQRIRARRLARNETATVVAAAIGTSDGAIYHWEGGRHSPTVVSLRHLADHFGCLIDDLVPSMAEAAPENGREEGA